MLSYAFLYFKKLDFKNKSLFYDNIYASIFIICFCWMAYFYIQALFNTKYLIGHPKVSKFWPQRFFILWIFIFNILKIKYSGHFVIFPLFWIVYDGFLPLTSFLIYSQDDDSDSCWLCFKPYKFKANNDVSHFNSYSQQQYPSQYPQIAPQTCHDQQQFPPKYF